MVSDDDSSTLKVVKESKPYETYNIEVERIKCSFHIFRSVGTKIREAAKARVPNRRVPAAVRNRIKYSGLKIRRTITADIERLRKDFESESLSKAEKEKIFEENTEVLRKNILLAPLHVFGDHAQCPTEWSCDKSKSNHLPKIKEYGLYSRIEKIITDLSQNAIHLLHFLNTNKIEQYHGVLAKYFSGKRIQYGGADEFHDKVYMGTLDQITSGAHLSTFYKFVKKSVPERIVKLEKERNYQRRTYHGPDKDYGSNAAQPDLCETDPVNYQQYKEDHHDKLRERQRNRNSLEVETRNHPFGVQHGYEKDIVVKREKFHD
ncbi:Protein of unknown function [Cotesia congregata]|uniref:Mutator-like transposase domain-containing protein n=1 Tax=Cotesia congregata TaxID=51543 RepID=A0A8J2H8M1_COTCN|nr:Protein of unknown function [Cotesia congregata]